MGFESDSSEFERMPIKKLVILFILAFAGALFFIQLIQGFPIRDLFREKVTEEVVVVIKQGGDCVVEPADQRPRKIQDCPYNVGDAIVVTYTEGTLPIESHRLSNSVTG